MWNNKKCNTHLRKGDQTGLFVLAQQYCQCLPSHLSHAVPFLWSDGTLFAYSVLILQRPAQIPSTPWPVPLPSSPNPCASHKSSLSSGFTENLVCTYLHHFPHSSVQDICFQVLCFLLDYQLLYLESDWVLFISECPFTTNSVPIHTASTKSMLTEQNFQF